MPNSAQKPKEYVMGDHHFRIEKSVPLPDEGLEVENVELLPIDKLKPFESLATDYEYSPKTRDAVKSKVVYLTSKSPHRDQFKNMKFGVRKDPMNEKKIRIYRLN